MQKIFGILALFIFSILIPVGQVFANSDSTSSLVISELKIDGGSSTQFVSLYNPSSLETESGEFILEYARPTFDGECSDLWSLSGGSSIILDESIEPGSYLSISISFAMLDNDGGSFRVVDSVGLVTDLVAWDSPSSTAPCFDNANSKSVAPWADNNESIRRYLDCDTGEPVDTDINGLDFYLAEDNTDFFDNCPDENEPPIEIPTDPGGGTGSEPPVNSCQGIIINELFVNPAGSDDGKEFIEIFNPTSGAISLDGCKLQTSANSKIYTFPNSDVASGEFIAFYSSQTGLTLSNSSGGSVYLINSDDTELQSVLYPAELEDDKSWSLIDGEWFETFSATSGHINQLLSVKPCPEGQFRNTETNRCNNIILEVAGLAACKPGQSRNFETNRCRNIASFASSLKACEPDQYRNPETNRCKNINSASSLASCKEGQERNPETNRCRNVASLSSSDIDNQVQDVISKPSSSQMSWWLAAGSLVGAFIYGLWEWRNDLALYLLGLKNKLSGGV